MRLLLILFVLGTQLLPAQEPYRLLWSEEFDSCCINYNRWQNKYPWGRSLPQNFEQQFYTAGNNFELQEGLLRIKVLKEDVTARVDSNFSDEHLMSDSVPNLRDFGYTSGLLYSKAAFEYGKFEIRCKVPKGRGMWPAFWLYGGWPQHEIDIFEYWAERPRTIASTIHFTNADGMHESESIKTRSKTSFHKNYMTVTLEWLPDSLKYYVNGVLTGEMNVSFKGAKHLIVNLAISAKGQYISRKQLPKSFNVDYIRVWEWTGNKN